MGTPIIPDAYSVPDPLDIPDAYSVPDPGPQEAQGLLQRGFNALNNFRRLMGSTNPLLSGLVTDEEKEATWEALRARPKFGEVVGQIGSNIKNFDANGVIDAAGQMVSQTVDAISERSMMENVKAAGATAVNIPIAIASAVTIDPLKALFGVSLTDEVMQPLSTEDRAKVIQSVAGDVIAGGLALKTSKALGATRKQVAGRMSDEAAFNTELTTRGRIGRAMTDDVIAATVAGVTTGAIAGAGQENTAEQIAMGVLFAPLGVATGYMRSLRSVDGVEQVVTEKATNYFTNQLQKSREGSLAEIELAGESLIHSDYVASAVLTRELKVKDDAIGVLPRVQQEVLDSIDEKISPELGGVVMRPGQDGTVDVLFWGKNRPMNQKQINYWIQNGALMPDPDVGLEGLTTRFQGNEFVIERVVGDNVVLRDPSNNSKFTINKNVVPLADVRPREVLPSHVADKYYADFSATYMDPKNTLSFNDNLVNFATKHNLVDQLDAVAAMFERKIEQDMRKLLDPDEVARFDQLKKELHESLPTLAADRADNLHQAASNNGMYVSYENGKFVVKEHGTAEIIGEATNSADALRIITETGSKVGPNLNGATPLPPGLFSGAIPAHAMQPYQIDRNPKGFLERVARRIDSRLTSFDAAHPGLTLMAGWVEGVDGVHGTTLKTDAYMPTQAASRRTKFETQRYMNSPRMKQISALMHGMDDVKLQEISAVRESMTVSEMMQKDGLAKDYKPSAMAISFAHKFAQTNIRFEPVLKTRRALFALDQEFHARRAEARFTAEQTVQRNNFGMDRDAYLKYKDDVGTAAERSLDGEYQVRRQEILSAEYEGAPLRPEEIDAISAYDTLGKKGEFEIYAATRIAQALLDPETLGKGRTALMKEKGWHRLSKEALLIEEIDRAYDELAKIFNISDVRKLNNYMNHYRQWGDPNDAFGLDRFLTGLESDSARRFVSDMVRTGELEHFESNAARALESYVRAGYKANILYPALNQMKEVVKRDLAKIKNSYARKEAFRRFVDYEIEISGQKSDEIRAAEAYGVEFLKKLGLDDAEIIKELRTPDALDTAISLTSAGLMGARPMMGMRDLSDVTVKYFILNGAKRTKNFLLKKITKENYEWLKKEGVVDDVAFDEFYNPGLREQGVRGTLAKGANKAAEVGFQTSLQPHAFKRAQAAAYMESHDFIRDALNDFMYGRNGLDSKEKLMDKLQVMKHDDAVIQEFDARVSAGNVQEAVKFLAKEEARLIAGTFGHGNYPSTRNKWGRLFNQMGMWSIGNRSIYNKIMFRGSKKDIAARMLRYGTSQMAIYGAGRLAGVNMASWMVTPASFVFTGGPLLSFARETAGAGIAVGGDDNQQNYAFREARRSAFMLVPFGYAMKDWMDAYELSQWADPQYTVLQAMGFKVSEQYMFE